MAKKTVTTEVGEKIVSIASARRSTLIKRPRITEKATILSMADTYTFDVASSATKRDIVMAVRDTYKVVPVAVRMVRVVPKTVRSRKTGKLGVRQGGKKAYVTLKKGESITI